MKDFHSTQEKTLNFLRRFHLVIFIVVTVIFLSAAVMLLYRLAGKASGTDMDAPAGTSSSFDQQSIERIEQLKTSDEPSVPLDLSGRRINPFNE